MSLVATDLVEPYLSFVWVDNVTLLTDILLLMGRNCQWLQAIQVQQTLSQVTVEWMVDGALKIDETQLHYGKWSNISAVNCLLQLSTAQLMNLVPGVMSSMTAGTGHLSKFGVLPLTISSDSPLGPSFKGCVPAPSVFCNIFAIACM